MGAVYLAHDPLLDRLVALKIPRPFEDDPLVWRERFQAEARAAATLHHPNICPVFEVGEVDSRPYLTMAYIEGETLAARLRRTGPPPIPEALALVSAIARAMAAAHDRGIVHRDLKPANVIIDRRGQPVVMDFGLALRATAADDLRLTLSGVAMGTPSYMPPEQAGGDHDAIGPPTDAYALGVILYELLTGRVPFQGKTFGKLLAQIERDPPPLPAVLNPEIDLALEAIILRALAKAPEDRFATAGALADALDAYSKGERDGIVAKYGARQDAQLTGPYTSEAERTRPAGTAAKTAPRRPRWIAMAAGVIGIALLALLAWIIYQQTDNPATGEAKKKPEPLPPIDFLKQAKLEGTWRLVSGEIDGRKVPQGDIKHVSMVIRGDRATVAEGEQTSEAEIRVNTAAKPKQIDTKYLSGPEKGFTALGIYELDGDTLRICHTSKAKTERPEMFETAENSWLVLGVWKREKK
jgi:uncharacterized protein (TIGR03067 family)